MKKILTLIISFGVLSAVYGQEKEVAKIENPNQLKVNLLTLATGKIAVEYERMLTNRLSAGVAFALKPKGGLPFKSTIMDKLDGDDELLNLISGFKSSTTSITPELRFYTSKRGSARGFYLAPYVKYAKFDFSAPYVYEVEDAGSYRTEEIALDGDLKTFSAGLSLGFNFKLSKNFYLDWRLFGPGYGTAKGSVAGKMALDADEQDGLRQALDDLKLDLADLPVKINMEHSVNNEGAEITITKSPWANIRSGLSIVYKF